MPSTHTSLHYHLVWSTKDRRNLIEPSWCSRLHAWLGGCVKALDGVPLALSRPTSPTAALVDGKIVTTHLRAVDGSPAVTGTLSFKPYDGTYYTAYEVGLGVTVRGRSGCEIILDEPDINGALAMTKAELAAIPEDMDIAEAGFGDIGVRFATDVRLTCSAP